MPAARYPVLLLLLVFFCAISAYASPDQTISGTLVQNSGRFSCPGCEVRLELIGLRRSSVTYGDSSGNFTFWSVPQGSYTIRVAINGIEEASQTLEVLDSGSMTTNVTIAVRGR